MDERKRWKKIDYVTFCSSEKKVDDIIFYLAAVGADPMNTFNFVNTTTSVIDPFAKSLKVFQP